MLEWENTAMTNITVTVKTTRHEIVLKPFSFDYPTI